ncbi:MAG: BrnT family toxin [Spirochaetes bacterium]|nr:BrnT family toxin [Spirochaetota bacterium]
MLIWDERKNRTLIEERGLSFEEIAEKIIKNEVIDILKHSKRESQKIFVITINNYTYAVPFIEDRDNNIILKTAYPSRKLHARYGERK